MQFLTVILATCISVSYACGPGVRFNTGPGGDAWKKNLDFCCITTDGSGEVINKVCGTGCNEVAASACNQVFGKNLAKSKFSEIKTSTNGVSLSGFGSDVCNAQTCLGSKHLFINSMSG